MFLPAAGLLAKVTLLDSQDVLLPAAGLLAKVVLVDSQDVLLPTAVLFVLVDSQDVLLPAAVSDVAKASAAARLNCCSRSSSQKSSTQDWESSREQKKRVLRKRPWQ